MTVIFVPPKNAVRRLLHEAVNSGEVAVVAVVIETVADDETFWQAETDVIDVELALERLWLEHQNRNFHRPRAKIPQHFEHFAHRDASLHNVFHDDHVLASDVAIEAYQLLDLARRGRAGVRRHLHKLDVARHLDVFHKVCRKHKSTVEYAHKPYVAALVVAVDFVRHTFNIFLYFVGGDANTKFLIFDADFFVHIFGNGRFAPRYKVQS